MNEPITPEVDERGLIYEHGVGWVDPETGEVYGWSAYDDDAATAAQRAAKKFSNLDAEIAHHEALARQHKEKVAVLERRREWMETEQYRWLIDYAREKAKTNHLWKNRVEIGSAVFVFSESKTGSISVLSKNEDKAAAYAWTFERNPRATKIESVCKVVVSEMDEATRNALFRMSPDEAAKKGFKVDPPGERITIKTGGGK